MKKILVMMLCIGVICIGAGMSIAAQDDETGVIVRVAGAESMWGRIFTHAALYMRENPQVKIRFTKISLVDEGMRELINKKADIAMASRKATPQEMESAKSNGLDLVEKFIGYGGIVIITSLSNPVEELTIDQIRKIFTGEYTNWKDVGGSDQPIVLFRTGETRPGTLVFFEKEILLGKHISSNAEVLIDFPSVIDKISVTPDSISYTRIRDAFETPIPSVAKIKPLKIKRDDSSPAISPSRSTVGDGSYPLRRPYYFYTRNPETKEVKDFSDFIVSKGWGEQKPAIMGVSP